MYVAGMRMYSVTSKLRLGVTVNEGGGGLEPPSAPEMESVL